jgi:hypothetical protein
VVTNGVTGTLPVSGLETRPKSIPGANSPSVQ